MVHGACFLICLVLAAFLGHSLGFKLQSEETTLPRQLTAVVLHGKRLKLKVENVKYSADLWQFNGTSTSEKCEVTKFAEGSTLICRDMDWQDEGLYEYQGITRSGQKETILAVMVKVVECEKQEPELLMAAPKDDYQCFCSGITSKCKMAENLYRSKLTATLQDIDRVPLRWPNYEPSNYYSLPKSLRGNLLMSYGGFLEIQAINDNVEDNGPEVVLEGNYLTLVFYHKRELETSGERDKQRVQMTEHNWRHLNGSNVFRNEFMTVLSNVTKFYIKCKCSDSLKSLRVVLDSADVKDHRLGQVSTVEACECRVGYTGLSCETCDFGFIRRHVVGPLGICISLKEYWNELKQSIDLKHRERWYSHRKWT